VRERLISNAVVVRPAVQDFHTLLLESISPIYTPGYQRPSSSYPFVFYISGSIIGCRTKFPAKQSGSSALDRTPAEVRINRTLPLTRLISKSPKYQTTRRMMRLGWLRLFGQRLVPVVERDVSPISRLV